LCVDLRRLAGEGFAIEAVSLFDMFPQTRHVEAVAWLERRAVPQM
jgi:tRNA/tmRNA/rRNA uracil-C5-methylase (TrmA/RlmC/RlmD family)